MASNDSPGCLAYLIGHIIVGIPAAFAVQYLIGVFFQKDIPWYGDLLLGLLTSGYAILAALVVWLLQIFGVL